jgi:hypothetical protein
LEIQLASVCGTDQGRLVSERRYLLAALAVERWGVSTRAIAGVVGHRADVVTRWCRIGRVRWQAEEAFRVRYEVLDRRLAAVSGG